MPVLFAAVCQEERGNYMNWGHLGSAVLGNLTHVVTLVELLRGKRKGKQKQDVAVDLFFAVLQSQDGKVARHLKHAEDEVRVLIDAFVALENKVGNYSDANEEAGPDGVSSFRVVEPTPTA